MNKEQLEQLKKEAWEIHNREYDINVEPCDEFDFKEGFNAGVEAMREEVKRLERELKEWSKYED